MGSKQSKSVSQKVIQALTVIYDRKIAHLYKNLEVQPNRPYFVCLNVSRFTQIESSSNVSIFHINYICETSIYF